MKIRRKLMKVALSVTLAVTLQSFTASVSVGAAEVGDDGLHKQPWFLDSFLELAEDHGLAQEADKHFVVLFEQRGCPYCRELHEVNLDNQKIQDFITPRFDVLQLDIWGSRTVTDFNGVEMEERDLARAWQVNFTPTIIFFPKQPDTVEGKTGREAEIARMPGYFRPFHFVSMFEFVHGEHYLEQSFQRYLQEKFTRIEAEGGDPDVW